MSQRHALVLLYGLVSGLLLSALRAPAGLDLTQVPVADATTAAFFRAGALFGVALFLDPLRPLFRRGVPVALLLAGTTLGFGLHGLWLGSLFEPSTRLGFAALLVGGTVVFYFATRGGAVPELPGNAPVDAPFPPLAMAERAALVLLGAGAALALENGARHLRLLSLGLPEDDTVLAVVLLVTLLVGVVAFGRLLARPGWGRTLIAAGMLLGIGSTLVGLHHLQLLVDGGLFRYLRRPFGLDESLIGTLGPTAVIAGASFALPGFLIGSALAGARHPRRLASLLVGGAVGTVLVPFVIDLRARGMKFEEAVASAWSFELVAAGLAVAAVGGVVLCARYAKGRARTVGLALVLAGAVVPFALPRPSVWPLTPWWPAPIEPDLLWPLPEGLLTVEPTVGGVPAVTLDRRRLTPTPLEEGMDADRIRWSVGLLSPATRSGPGPRVLFIGQLTPARTAAFATVGPLRLERTAPWYPALEEVEKRLFADSTPPPGRAIPPAEARRRIRKGQYDLVLVAPVRGPLLPHKSAQVFEWGTAPAPVTGGWDVPAGTTGVVWLDAASPLAARDLGDQVILAVGSALEELSVGVVLGHPSREPSATLPLLFDPGPPTRRASALSLLRMRADERVRRGHAATASRLESGAAKDSVAGGMMRGLRIHYGAQRRSSPYESMASQIEFERAELEAFHGAAGPPLDAFSRRVWEAAAWFLTEKREIEDIVLFLEPIAKEYGPWPALDRASARAWEEFGEPEEACFHLERLVAARPHDIEVLVEAATWLGRAGRHDTAVQHLRHALELQGPSVEETNDVAEVLPRNRLRLLGIHLVHLGDPEGRAILEALRERNPYDLELQGYLEEGPLPELPREFQPEGGLDDHRP